MIVASVMKRNPVFVRPDVSLTDAKALMEKEKIGKLPVLDKNDRLVGLLTRKDLAKASPSDATTLDIFEIGYLLSKLKVEKIMTKNVVSVQENEVVEEAARIMADNDVGCLPVLKGDLLVGIITESDLFHEFVDMFGARYNGVRITAILNEKPGQLATFTAFIAEAGGNIVSLVTSEADDLTKRCCTCKVTGLKKEDVEDAFKKTGAEITDVRVI